MFKKLAVRTLSTGVFSKMGERRFNQFVPVFMLHRFKCKELGIDGHEPAMLKQTLEMLVKRGFSFVSLDDIAQAIASESLLPEKSIAFSLDDGYWDQLEASAKIFASYDCPATYFVTTGFINGDLWFWDAKVHYLLEMTQPNNLIKLRHKFPSLLPDEIDVEKMANAIVFALTSKAIVDIEKSVLEMSALLEVDLPEKVPEKYMPTSWSRLAEAERMGMKVGPHTYSHPLLSRETDSDSFLQMKRSKEDLQAKIQSPARVFCYPVGREQDFGKREEGYAEKLDYLGAVSAVPKAVDLKDKSGLFHIPRYGFPDNIEDVIQYSTWIESFKNLLRRA